MFWIDSLVMTPDIEYMKEIVMDCMEQGIRIADLTELKNAYNTRLKDVSDKLWSRYHLENPNSPKQVLAVLDRFADGRVRECCYDEEEDNWTTNADALTRLSGYGFEFADLMLEYRGCKQRMDVLNGMDVKADEYGFVHPIVSLGKSNRINYSKPALMNVNKDMLFDILRPRNPRNVLFSCDIKNQEPWILINMLAIKSLKSVMATLGDDESLYRALFFEIFDRGCKNEVEYNETKTAWNALTYGCSKRSVVKMCKTVDGAQIYKKFMGVKELKDFRDNCIKLAYAGVQEVRTYFGTKVYADEVGKRLQRVLMDIQIQGTGSDILALLIKHCIEEFEERGLSEVITIYYTRHDEILFEVDRDFYEEAGADEVASILKNITEHKVDDWEPFRVEVKEVFKK